MRTCISSFSMWSRGMLVIDIDPREDIVLLKSPLPRLCERRLLLRRAGASSPYSDDWPIDRFPSLAVCFTV
jgi:hypothetical protein